MTTEFIMVPVPRERVQEVYRLLATEPVIPTVGSTDGSSSSTAEPWSDGDIIRAYRESPGTMKLFLDYLASVAGKPVTAEETAKAVGYTRHQQAGMLGAFGRRVKNRYGRSTWFFTYGWNDQREEWTYSMEASVGKVLKGIDA
jgi:hypothetical protein